MACCLPGGGGWWASTRPCGWSLATTSRATYNPRRHGSQPAAGAGYALFGSEVPGDVLSGLTAEFASGLLPAPLAAALVYFIAAAFTFNLLVNFTLKVGGAARACWLGWLGSAALAEAAARPPAWRWNLSPTPRPPRPTPPLAGVGGA